jgi:transcriptional regulator with XRE-family HTH domain
MTTRPVRVNPTQVENPLKHTRQLLNLTIDTVASRTQLSRQFIIRAEQGVYSDAPDSLISYYAALMDLDTIEIQQRYFNFQFATRKANYGRLIEPWAFPVGSGHPFINWREFSGVGSTAGICKLFCVHPATMNKFEHRPHLLNSVPEQLTAALLESGYSAETLDLLEIAYSNYKIRLREVMEVILGEPE